MALLHRLFHVFYKNKKKLIVGPNLKKIL